MAAVDPVTAIPGLSAGTPGTFGGIGGVGAAGLAGNDPTREQFANSLSIISKNMQDLLAQFAASNGDSAAQQLLITKIQEQTKQTEQMMGLFASVRALPFTFSDKFGQKLGV